MNTKNYTKYTLPPQMLPINKKGKIWGEKTMDALESIAMSQLNSSETERMVENYLMLKGKFIFKQYVEDGEYEDLISMLSTEFKVPSRLRHYDILSQIVNTLSGEMEKRPDLYRVVALGEVAENNYLRTKTDLLHKYVNSVVDEYLRGKLLEEGYDIEKEDFVSEEEAAAYKEQIAQRRKELTPPEIQRYMNTTWRDSGEIWSEAVLKFDEERFNLSEKKRIEFNDFLSVEKAYRHYYTTPTGYSQETWNPLNVFSENTSDGSEGEKGRYIGRMLNMSNSEFINRYGHKLDEETLYSLEDSIRDNYNTSKDSKGANNFIDNKSTFVQPYLNYQEHLNTIQVLGTDPVDPFNEDAAVLLGTIGNDSNYRTGEVRVVEAYWKSQRKIGKFNYISPETGQVVSVLVDETIDLSLLPKVKIEKVSIEEFEDSNKPYTLVWTWVNQVYKGKKATFYNKKNKSIYFDIGPNDFQGRSSENPFEVTLPVVCLGSDGRIGQSCSLVDLAKPHQIGFNIAINQAIEILYKEKAKFLLMDVNLMYAGKDWGGQTYEKFSLVAEQLGLGLVDSRSANAKQSNFQHIQVVDLDESARIMSRLRIAEAFEMLALKQAGITPQRLGSIMASETATGVNQAVNQSYAQTESYFTRFFAYIKRCMEMNLAIAQHCAITTGGDLTLQYIESDLSRGFISSLSEDDLVGKLLTLKIVKSQEVVRQLETIRQYFLNNNTNSATPDDIATVIFSNSVSEIKAQLKTSTERFRQEKQSELQQQRELQEQQVSEARRLQEELIAKEDERLDKKLANDRYINEIRALGFAKETDTNDNNIPDVLEVQKFNHQLNKDSEDILFKKQEQVNKMNIEQRKLANESEKIKTEKERIKKESELKQKELDLKSKELETNLEIAKYNDKGKRGSKES